MSKFQKVADKIGEKLAPRVKNRKEVLELANDLAGTCEDLNQNLVDKMDEIIQSRTEKENTLQKLVNSEEEAKGLYLELQETKKQVRDLALANAVKVIIILGMIVGYTLSIIF